VRVVLYEVQMEVHELIPVMWSVTLVLLQDQSQTNRIRSWSGSCELWSWSWFCSTGLGLGLGPDLNCELGLVNGMRPHRARLGDKTLRDIVILKCNK